MLSKAISRRGDPGRRLRRWSWFSFGFVESPKPISTSATPLTPLSSRPKWRDLRSRSTPQPISTSATPLTPCHLDRSGEICGPLHPKTNFHVRNPSYPLSSRPQWRDLQFASTPKPISTSATPLTPCHLDRSGDLRSAPPPSQSPRPQPLLPLVISTAVERSAVPLDPQTISTSATPLTPCHLDRSGEICSPARPPNHLDVRNLSYPLSSRSGEICSSLPRPNQSPRPQLLFPLVISTEVERSAVRSTPKPISTSATSLTPCHLDRSGEICGPLDPKTNLNVRNPSYPLSSRPQWRDLQFASTPKPISPSATPLPPCHLDRSGEICGPLHPQANLNVRNPSYPLSSRPKWRDLQSRSTPKPSRRPQPLLPLVISTEVERSAVRSTPKPISTSATPLTLCHLDRSGEICSSLPPQTNLHVRNSPYPLSSRPQWRDLRSAPPPSQSPRPQPLLPLVISTAVERSAVRFHPQTNLHVRNSSFPLSSRPKWRDLRSAPSPSQSQRPQPLLPLVISTEVERSAVPIDPQTISTSATSLTPCHLDRSGEICSPAPPPNQSPRPQPLLPLVISTEVERSAVPLDPQTNFHVRNLSPPCHLDRSGEICGPLHPQANLNVRNPSYPLSSRPQWRDLRSRSTPKPISTSATPLTLCHLDRSGEICGPLHPQTNLHVRNPSYPLSSRPKWRDLRSAPPPNQSPRPQLLFPLVISTAVERSAVRSTPKPISTSATPLTPCHLDRSGEISSSLPPPNQSPRPQLLFPLVISTAVERSAVRSTPKPISTSATPLTPCHLDRSGEICGPAPPPNQSPRPQPLLPLVISTAVERSAVRSTPKPISTSATTLTLCHLDRSGEICSSLPPPSQSPRPQLLLPLVISTAVERSAVRSTPKPISTSATPLTPCHLDRSGEICSPARPPNHLDVRNLSYPLSSRPKWRDLRSAPPSSQSPRPQPLLPLVISTEVERSAVRSTPKPISTSATPLTLCHLDRSGEICGPLHPKTNFHVRNPSYPLSSRPKWRDLRSRSTPKPISTSATPLTLCHLDRSGEICGPALPPKPISTSATPLTLCHLDRSGEICGPLHPKTNFHVRNPPLPFVINRSGEICGPAPPPNQSPRPQPLLPFVISTEVERSAVRS